ncbi:MAG TPA: DUF2817 domain-containing protein [Candidatus Dojkabacteria bacterium]|nr:DUF2817 domain-containing protein [Candidatus Dojkabacteria bacterium]
MKMKKFALILLIIFSTLALGAVIAYFFFSNNYRNTKSITVDFGQNACIEEDYFLPNLLNFVEARQIPAYDNSEISEENANETQNGENENINNDNIVWKIDRENFGFKNSKICFSPNSKLKPETQYYLKYQWLFQDFEIIINVKDIEHIINYDSFEDSNGESLTFRSDTENMDYESTILINNEKITNQCTQQNEITECKIKSEEVKNLLRSYSSEENTTIKIEIRGTYKEEIEIEILSGLARYQGEKYLGFIDFNNGYGVDKSGQAMILGYTEKNVPIHGYIINRSICENIINNGGSDSKNNLADSKENFDESINNTFFYFGAIHGNEANTAHLVDKWKSDLIQHCNSIPQNTNIIILPSINPDGVAINNRFNSNSVDLNRNFDTKDWQQITYLTDGKTFLNGGGNHPFSEKETQLIRDIILLTRPELTISFHSWGRVIVPADINNSYTYANYYSDYSGYYVEDITASAEDSSFNYVTTGSFNVWMASNKLSALTIELWDLENDDWGRNRLALWDTISDINKLSFLNDDIKKHQDKNAQ